MEYKEGTHKIRANKDWICDNCQTQISRGDYYFARIKILENDYRAYTRYHFKCAKTLSDLNKYEEDLIKQEKHEMKNPQEKILRQQVFRLLNKQEEKGYLIFLKVSIGLFRDIKQSSKIIRIGRAGFSDFIIFFPNKETVFLELKRPKTTLNPAQIKFENDIKKLGFTYIIITTISDLYTLFKTHDIP